MADPIAESAVLNPRDPSIASEDDWPEFQLADAEVKEKKGHHYSLLLANNAMPMTVTGNLVLDKTQQHFLLPSVTQRSRPQIPLKLENVTHFSYGQYDDGEVDIWAAGSAGWFRIKPASSYDRTFQHMVKGVDVFYFIADAYSEQPRLSPEQLFTMYARKQKISEKSAKDTIYMQGRFLASQMIKGAEGIKWSHTAIYQHLRKIIPDQFEAMEKGIASYGLQKDDIKTKVDSIWDVIQKTANKQQLNPRSMTLETFAEAIYDTFTFDDKIQATDYLIFLAAELVSKIQHKHLSNRMWTESTFYSELLEADISRLTKAKMTQLTVQRRPNATLVSTRRSDDSESNSSSDEEIVNTRSSRHIKGGLRPKVSSKGTGKKGKSYTGPSNPEKMDLDDVSETSTSRKRKSKFRGDKPARRRRIVDSSDTSSPQSQELESETLQNRKPSDDFPLSSVDSSHSFLTLISTPALDTAANTPGDKWCCQHTGCNHAVYGASTDTGQELILEHLADHDEKMKLVFNENHRTNLPVGNLIRRIREISASRNEYAPTMIQRAL